MVLTIGQVDFQMLSGPTCFYILQPILYVDHPLILLMGDTHRDNDQQCIPTNQDLCNELSDFSVCSSTSSTGWYRVLDSVASKEQPIDYFVEYFYPLEEFKKVSDCSARLKYKTQDTDQTVMLYLIRNHFQCFYPKEKKQPCITQNINYHFADVRYTKDFFQDQLDPQIKFCFESQLFDSLNICILDPRNDFYINQDKKILAVDMIKLVLDDPGSYFDKVFDITNPYVQKHSLIIEELNKQSMYDIQFVKEYFLFVYNKLKNNELLDFIKKEILPIYDHEYKNMHDTKFVAWTQDYASMMMALILYQKFYVNPYNYQYYMSGLAFIMTSFTVEIYFFLRSINRQYSPWLSILNAGSKHTDYFVQFLIQKKIYKLIYTNDLKDQSLIRCSKFNEDINLDEYHNNDLSIIKKRIDTLGIFQYYYIKDGYVIENKEELQRLANDLNLSLDEIKEKCNFQTK